MKEQLRKDMIRLAILAALLVIIMKVLFHEEQLSVLIRTSASFIWLYILPGFVVMYAWHGKLDFLHRIIVGAAAGFAMVSAASYYLGMMGMHVKHHAYVIPPLVVVMYIAYHIYAQKHRKSHK